MADFVKDGGAILKHGAPYVGFLALHHGPPSTTLITRYIVLHIESRYTLTSPVKLNILRLLKMKAIKQALALFIMVFKKCHITKFDSIS
jgi:hypothetical protein